MRRWFGQIIIDFNNSRKYSQLRIIQKLDENPGKSKRVRKKSLVVITSKSTTFFETKNLKYVFGFEPSLSTRDLTDF